MGRGSLMGGVFWQLGATLQPSLSSWLFLWTGIRNLSLPSLRDRGLTCGRHTAAVKKHLSYHYSSQQLVLEGCRSQPHVLCVCRQVDIRQGTVAKLKLLIPTAAEEELIELYTTHIGPSTKRGDHEIKFYGHGEKPVLLTLEEDGQTLRSFVRAARFLFNKVRVLLCWCCCAAVLLCVRPTVTV